MFERFQAMTIHLILRATTANRVGSVGLVGKACNRPVRTGPAWGSYFEHVHRRRASGLGLQRFSRP
jgi:hypothetical protein